jgi:hypothetical protein
MSTGSKSDVLRASAKQAIDAIVNDGVLDDDTKEEVLEELQTYLEDQQRIFSDVDDEDDDPDEIDEIDEDDEEDEE